MKTYITQIDHKDITLNQVIELLTPESNNIKVWEELLGIPEGSFYNLSPQDAEVALKCVEDIEKVSDLDLKKASPPKTVNIQDKEYTVDYNIKRQSWYAQQMFLDQAKAANDYVSIKIALAIYMQILIDGSIGTEKRVEEVYQLLENHKDGLELFKVGFFLLKRLSKRKKKGLSYWIRSTRRKINIRDTISH